MSNYVMFMSDHIKVSSIVSYLAGIAQILEPYYPSVRTVRASTIVKDTILGCKRLRNTPTIRKSPITTSMLRAAIAEGFSSYDDLLFQTMLVTAFHALLRLGDITIPDNSDIRNPAKSARRSSVTRLAPDAWSFTLPAHKADRFFEGSTVILKNLWADLNVIDMFNTFLVQRDCLHPYLSPLWLTESGVIPTRRFFLSWLQNLDWGPAIKGQSMRAGGATALADLGASPDIIQAIGRWSSEAWKIYVRKHPILLDHFVHHQSANGPPQHQPSSSS